jgi:hypothetical protein
MEGFSVASEPGRWWVDSIPARRKDIVIFMLKTDASQSNTFPPGSQEPLSSEKRNACEQI